MGLAFYVVLVVFGKLSSEYQISESSWDSTASTFRCYYMLSSATVYEENLLNHQEKAHAANSSSSLSGLWKLQGKPKGIFILLMLIS